MALNNSGSFSVRICINIISSLVLFSLMPVLSYAEVLTLPDGLKLAIEKSRLIRISGSEEMIAAEDARISGAKLLPTINADSAWTSLSSQPSAIFGPQTVPLSQREFVSYSVSIQQTLYDFMGNASKYGSKKIIFNARKLETVRVRNLVAIDFVLAYLDLLESEKTVSVAQKEVEMIELHHRDARNMFDEGVITKNELLQAEVKMSDAKQRLLTASNIRTVNESRINSLLLRPLQTGIQTVDIPESSSFTMPALDMGQAWKIAEKERAEIRIADETLKSLDLEEKAKRADYFPKFFVRGGYDFTENKYQTPDGNWSLIFGINMNLFQGGATRAEVAKIEYQKQELLEQRDRLLDEIRLEVEKSMLYVMTAREKLVVTKGTIQQAEENLRINRVKYEEGEGTGTDVLDAITLLTLAETNYFRAFYDLLKAEAAVVYAIGKDPAEVYK